MFPNKITLLKLTNLTNKCLSKCSIPLYRKSRIFRLIISSNVPDIISRILLTFIESSVNFVSPLNAPNSIVLSTQLLTINISSSVSPLETNLSLSSNVMLFLSSLSTRTSVRWIKGTAVNDGPSQRTMYPAFSHWQFSGHNIATLAGMVSNTIQNITADVANSSDTNTTVSLDGMASCCNLHRERN